MAHIGRSKFVGIFSKYSICLHYRKVLKRSITEPNLVRCYSKDKEAKMGLEPVKAIGHRFLDWDFSYTSNNTIQYALGVGVSTSQSDHLKFLYEGSDDFTVLPTYAIVPAAKCFGPLMTGNIPGLTQLDDSKVLHGEQYLEIYRAMPRGATLRNECVVSDVLDKRSSALVHLDVNTYNAADNSIISFNQFSIFFVGAGNFGGRKQSDHLKPSTKPPSRAPDFSVSQATSINQAVLYALNGAENGNSVHIDPEIARRGGFSGPILQGLCTVGFACRHVLQRYANNDVTKFKAIKVRFSKPVYPGQTITTHMWRDGNRVYFQTELAETSDVVISGAYIDFHQIDN